MVRATTVVAIALLAVFALIAARLVLGAVVLLVKFGGLVLVGFLVAYALYELRCHLRRA